MLARERQKRLAAAMAEAGIDIVVLYGNAWQGDYLRYGADFGILEGHGIALVNADGGVELFLDSATDAERAELEAPAVTVHLAPDIARVVGARLDRAANARIAAAPRRFLPRWLADATRSFKLDDATALLDKLLMHKSAGEIAAVRRAAEIADEAYVEFLRMVRPGRRQFEIVADLEAHLRRRGCPDNFMIIGSGGKDVLGMTPPSERRIAVGDLVTTELTPAVDGYFAQICRTLVVGKASEAQRRAFGVFVEALEAGIAAVRPGVRAADVAKAENDVFRKHGLGEYTTSQWTRVRGHGIGMFADSKPHILEDVNTVLEPGMTLIVHPNTYHPDVGYIVLGDALAVTDTGAEVLCRTPRQLFEVAA
ncbi:MAG TPA: Xaa-Pro peptidase family protein [Xanthobacteraceae bacterium]|nr:Xaa-Pro peptidase family protein [Xanthobacteraceae bacterium]